MRKVPGAPDWVRACTSLKTTTSSKHGGNCRAAHDEILSRCNLAAQLDEYLEHEAKSVALSRLWRNT
jgi:hypothetical protein